MKKYLFIAFAVLFTCNLSAQEDKEKKLTAFIEYALEKLQVVPGVSVTVVNEDGAVFTKGFGYADLENKVPATAETNFYIASATKPFMGLLATILGEEIGISDLNTLPLTDLKPYSEFVDNKVFQNISVMDLLSHQGGIYNEFLGLKLTYTGEYTEEQIIKLIEEDTRPIKEGKKFSYMNFGYHLVAKALRHELGREWRDLLEEKVLSPLKMYSTTGYMSDVDKNQLALPHFGVFPEKVQQATIVKTDKTMHAAGGLVTSAEDMSKFLSFYINKGKVGGKQIYPAEWIERTYTKQVSATQEVLDPFNSHGYATGWQLGNYGGHEIAYHFGDFVGFNSNVSFIPKEKLGVFVCVNGDGLIAAKLVTTISKYAYDLYLGNEKKLKEHKKSFQKILAGEQRKKRAEETKFAKRTWQLSLPKQSYTGTYYHEKVGTVKIAYKNEELTIQLANLPSVVCTPFPKKDSFRFELVPNVGIATGFKVEGKQVKGLSFEGILLKKMK